MSSPSKDEAQSPAQGHMVAVPKVALDSPGDLVLCGYRSASKYLPLSYSLHFSHAAFPYTVPSVIFFPLLKTSIISRGNASGSQNKRQASLLRHT